MNLNVLNAQETVTIGEGTAINLSNVPCKTNYDNTLSQQIFLSEDFQGKTGNITSYAFKCAKDLSTNYSGYKCNFKIYMTNTDKTSFESASDYVNMSLESLVFEGEVSFQPKDEWTIINFDTPFEYEEGKNVLLCISNSSPYMGVSMTYYSHSTTGYGSISTYADGTPTPFDVTNIIPAIDKAANTNVTHSQFTFEDNTPAVMPSSVPEITSIEATHNSVTLSWNEVENAKKYNVYTSTGDLVTTVSETSCTIENLDELTEYCYQVSAVNGEYETAKSTANCATTLEYNDPLVGKQFRLRALTYNEKYEYWGYTYYYGPYELGVAKYLHIDNTAAAGLKVIDKVDSNAQRFTFEPTGVVEGQYYLRSADGYYINCGEWDVSAYDESQKSPIEVVYLDDTQTQFYLTNGTGTNGTVRHFKVETAYGDGVNFKPFCDAAQQYAAKWIVEEVEFQAIATVTDEEIYDDQTTTLSVIAFDGSGYTYSWSPANGLSDATSANPTFTPATTGEHTFTCTVTDTESGSTAEASVTVYVNARPALQLTVSADKGLIYNDDETAVLTATVTEGTGYAPYTYSWTLNGEAIEGATEATYTFSNTTVGEYTLTCTVTDARNNTQTASTTIEVKDASEKPKVIEIGTNSNEIYSMLPLYTYYNRSITQQIYTSEELGGNAVNIKSVSFEMTSTATGNVVPSNIDIYLINTDKNSFASAKDMMNLTDDDKYYTGSHSFDVSGWIEFVLEKPFEYTGGNLLICVVSDKDNWYGAPNFKVYKTGNVNRSVIYYKDAAPKFDHTNVNNNSQNASAQYCNYNNNVVKFGYEIPAPKPENLVATPAQIHVGETTTLTWNELEGAESYNIYVDGVLNDNTEELTYELSGLTYNLEPGHTIEVAAVYEDETESGKASVTVQVAGTFTIEVIVTDGTNYIENAEVYVDITYAYDEFFNKLEIEVEPAITNEQGFANVTLPLLAKYYDEYDGMWITPYYTVKASKAPYSNAEDNVYCAYISNSQTIGRTLVLTLPTVSYIQVQDEEGNDLYSYVMEGTNLVLSWDEVEDATAYKVYKLNHLNEIIEEYVVTDATYQAYAEYNADGFKYGVSAIFNDIESNVTYTSIIKVIGEGTIKGKITDGTNPISDVIVYLEGTSLMGEEVVPDMTTNELGEFEFNVTEGTYTLSVSHYDYEEYVSENVEIDYDMINDLGTIELTPKASIENVTVTADNNGNVSWTGDYTKWNVYRRNTNAPQELTSVATKVTTTSTTDAAWETLEPGTYQYGVAALLGGGSETIYTDDFSSNKGWTGSNWIVSGNVLSIYSNSAGFTRDITSPSFVIGDNAPIIQFDYTNDNDNVINISLETSSSSIIFGTIEGGSSGTFTSSPVDMEHFGVNVLNSEVKIKFSCSTGTYSSTIIDNLKVYSESPAITTQIVWSDGVVKQGPNTFEGTVSTDWNEEENWSNGVVPADGAEVTINANAVITGAVNVSNVTINAGTSLTVANGGALTVTGTISQASNYLLVLEEGGQIFQNNNNVTARFRMSIDNPTDWSDEANKDGWQFISMPFNDALYSDFAGTYNPSTGQNTCDYDLYKYDGSQDLEWLNYRENDWYEDKFMSGYGYLASRKEVSTVNMYGTLNVANPFAYRQYAYSAEKPLVNFHLVGNPFSHDINWTDFTISGTYFDSESGSVLENIQYFVDGYAIVDNNGNYQYYTSADNEPIKVGQGFFIKTLKNKVNLGYTPKRSAKSASNNSLNITATGNAGEDNVIINLAGKSEGFDKLQNFNDAIATVYVAEDGKNYGIYNCDADVQEVELSFNANQMGNYTISIEPNGKFQTVTLVDRFTGIETNMLVEDYHFTAMSNVNTNRFIVRMVNGQESTDNSHFVYQSGEDLIIDAEGTVQIIDVMGRVLVSDEVESTNNRINVSGFQNGTYMVRVINGSEVKVEKVVIY